MRRRVRFILLLCAGLFALTVAAVAYLAWPTPPLRKGMSRDEVHAVFGQPVVYGTSKDGSAIEWQFGGPVADSREWYPGEPNVIDENRLQVYYINDKVVAWEDSRKPRMPAWLDRIVKAIGW